MVVTAAGISMFARPVQPENAYLPMVVTVDGITVFMQPVIIVLLAVSMMALQLPRESKAVFPLATVIDVSPAQLPKGDMPIA